MKKYKDLLIEFLDKKSMVSKLFSLSWKGSLIILSNYKRYIINGKLKKIMMNFKMIKMI